MTDHGVAHAFELRGLTLDLGDDEFHFFGFQRRMVEWDLGFLLDQVC
jgi:hypothetical protein